MKSRSTGEIKSMLLPNSFIETTKYFGLCISHSSLKAVSLNSNNEIDSYAQYPLEKGVLGGQVEESEAFINGLNTIKTQGKFESAYVSVVLPETFAFSREFSTPKVSISELGEAIDWQVDEIFPFSTEEIYYDWKLMSSTEQEIKALVVSMQRGLIDSLRKSLAGAGLFPISFEPAVSALSRISTIAEKEFVVLIDIDQKGLSSSLIHRGVSLLTTTNPNTPSQQIINTIQSSITSLLSYYQDKNEKALEKYEVLLTGDLAEENLLTSINNQLKIKASIININRITPPFHKAFAAAYSNILPPESEHSINLLPQDLSKWYQNHYHQSIYKTTSRYLFGVLAASVIMTASSLLYLNIQNNNILSPTPIAVDSQVSTTNPQVLLKQANQINSLFSQKIGPQEELEEVLSITPKTIQVESISFDAAKKRFQLYGVSKNRQDLLDFKNSLEESTIFNKVHLPLGALTSKDNSTFSIDFSVSPKK